MNNTGVCTASPLVDMTYDTARDMLDADLGAPLLAHAGRGTGTGVGRV
ncbi:hypothetical protein [Streptomyces sp. NPDC003032]